MNTNKKTLFVFTLLIVLVAGAAHALVTDTSVSTDTVNATTIYQNGYACIDTSGGTFLGNAIYNVSIGNSPNPQPLISDEYKEIFIGPARDYTTIQEAIDDNVHLLQRHRVVFKVDDGNYDEDIIFPSFIAQRARTDKNESGPIDLRSTNEDASLVNISSIFINGCAGDIYISSVTITDGNPYDNEDAGIAAYDCNEVKLHNITFSGSMNTGVMSYASGVHLSGTWNLGTGQLNNGFVAKHGGYLGSETTANGFNVTGTVTGNMVLMNDGFGNLANIGGSWSPSRGFIFNYETDMLYGADSVPGSWSIGNDLEVTADTNLDSGTLFVDASQDNIGIGDSTPSATYKLGIAELSQSRAGLFIYMGGVDHTGTQDQSALSLHSDRASSTGTLAHLRNDGSGNSFMVTDGDWTSNPFVITDGGKVGIRTTSPARSLHVTGQVRIEPQSAAPSSPALGDIYVDSDSNELCFYDGSSWTGLKAGGACA